MNMVTFMNWYLNIVPLQCKIENNQGNFNLDFLLKIGNILIFLIVCVFMCVKSG